MYYDLCKVMCYMDLAAEGDNSDEEEELPSVNLGRPILDTCPTAMLIQIEMSKAWRRIKMVNHYLGISSHRSLDMMNGLMQMNPRPLFMDDLTARIMRERMLSSTNPRVSKEKVI